MSFFEGITSFILKIIDPIIHIDTYLINLANYQGKWIYFTVFMIIFCETGLIIAPFLPGDSLLFVVGALAASNKVNFHTMLLLMSLAAIAGGMVNYVIGYLFGKKFIYNKEKYVLSNGYLKVTQEFYQKKGGISLILARFIPIFRTFTPFIAGLSQMSYRNFFYYNAIGALLWVISVTCFGYFLGNLSILQNKLHYLIIAVIAISIILPMIKWIFNRWKNYLFRNKNSELD